jgi:hypothetical protein
VRESHQFHSLTHQHRAPPPVATTEHELLGLDRPEPVGRIRPAEPDYDRGESDDRPDALDIVLDLDATDDPIHGHQLGRFFHGYYKNY